MCDLLKTVFVLAGLCWLSSDVLTAAVAPLAEMQKCNPFYVVSEALESVQP